MHITPRILLVTPAALVLIACGATEPGAMHPVNLAAAIAGGGSPAGGVTNNLIIGGQGGSVSISSAQMVLARIELANNSCAGGSAGNASPINASNQDDDEPSDSSDVDDGEASDTSDVDDGEQSDTTDVDDGDGESSDSTDVDDDDGESSDSTDVDDDDGESSDTTDVDNDSPRASICAPLQTGQVMVNLPLDGATTRLIADALVPAGTYTRLQANLQTVEVVGVYTDANGATHPFTLTPRLNAVSTIRFDAPVTVDASTINLILDVGVRSWFTDRSGRLLDPSRAANQRALERNILASLRARS